MSSIDQAFVKAFARRHRKGAERPESKLQTRTAAGEDLASQADLATQTSGRAGSPVGSVERMDHAHDQPGSLNVDRSVAETAQVWVDPIEDQIARADPAAAGMPTPHVEPRDAEPSPEGSDSQGSEDRRRPQDTPQLGEPSVQVDTLQPRESTAPDTSMQTEATIEDASFLQHIHTAYATVLSNLTFPSAETQYADATIPADALLDVAPEVTDAPKTSLDAFIVDSPDETGDSLAVEDQRQPLTDTELNAAEVTSAESVPAEPEILAGQKTSLPPFQAVWEVDVFDVPTGVADLFFEGTLFQQIAERMLDAVSTGLNSVLVTSAQEGEGRSSVAIGIAMAAAAAGVRVALVDADCDDPTLADDLRLDLQYGWVETVRGGLPIKEVAVHAVEDNVTLIPLMPPHGRTAATADEVVQLIDLLKDAFELIVIDGPVGSSANVHQCAAAVDSAIIVRDVKRTDTRAINEFSYRLRESGVHGIGVVENFV